MIGCKGFLFFWWGSVACLGGAPLIFLVWVCCSGLWSWFCIYLFVSGIALLAVPVFCLL